MSKQVYISADYSEDSGDRNVVEELIRWGKDSQHVTDFIDMSKVSSGSVSNDPDCRICDLKAEFNRQINASSAVIIVVGDKTACRTAGSACDRCTKEQWACTCTPYKHNSSGAKPCRVALTSTPAPDGDFGNINACSYIEHEFRQAQKKNKPIIVVYNSIYYQPSWLPSYMSHYESVARPFWVRNSLGYRVGNYSFIKQALGYV